MDKIIDFFDECVPAFQQIVKKPSHFLESNGALCDNITENLKKIYDFAKSEEIKTVTPNVLPELVIKNFDLEQIWQQIELQNNVAIEHLLPVVSKLVVSKNRLLDEDERAKENLIPEQSSNESLDETEEVNLNDVDTDDDEDWRKLSVEVRHNIKKSAVDDEFFKLDEMERFLQAEEKKLNDPDSGNDSEESDDDDDDEPEESVDLFQEASDTEDEAKSARYKDFFITGEKDRQKKTSIDEEEPRSSFETRQDRLRKKITEREEEAIQEKPWQLKGEIIAENRPKNSLLEEVVEFDMTSRPPPVITEQTTMRLEDIIKRRIKDHAFDSVERKAKPTETPLEYKKKLVLDQEKSKESLAQIYEREFIEQQSAVGPENGEKEEKEPELHQKINSSMRDLFIKLDALSNFHFTPKPAIPELKIISNLPAISMEEVAPVATSDASLLAPEEVKTKSKGDVVGKNERSAADKKRERRKKKLKQKIHVMEKRKKASPSLGNKYNKEKVKKVLDTVMKEKNVDKMDESFSDKSIKSSKAFFSQLEEQVKSQITKSSRKADQNDRNIPNAKKLKL